MENELKPIMTREDINNSVDAVMKGVLEKVKETIFDAVYDEFRSILQCHYDEFLDHIEDDLIKKISRDFVGNPKAYKYMELRKQIIKENAGLIIENGLKSGHDIIDEAAKEEIHALKINLRAIQGELYRVTKELEKERVDNSILKNLGVTGEYLYENEISNAFKAGADFARNMFGNPSNTEYYNDLRKKYQDKLREAQEN